MWNLEFNTFDDFLYIQAHDLGFLGPNFLDLLQCLKYTKASINEPSDGLYIWVKFYLMWYVEFNCLDDFLCTGVHDLRYMDPIFPTCPN